MQFGAVNELQLLEFWELLLYAASVDAGPRAVQDYQM